MTISSISRRQLLVGTASALALNACSGVQIPPATSGVTIADLKGLPYHPVPMHLDLCVLSYQLYAQTLVWPFDPYYERQGNSAAREAFMDQVRSWIARGDTSVSRHDVGGYRGPGTLAGFADNPRHDPIIYRYDSLNPWHPSLSLGDAKWTELQTPSAITTSISDVSMCYRPSGSSPTSVQIDWVATAGGSTSRGVGDQLIAFEGETGDKNEPGQPGSQSMMGFVLKREITGTEDYDIYIVFRGSRSGKPLRTAAQAFSETAASGNPDWITDLGYDFTQAADISHVGTLHRGMVQSVQSMLPKIIGCLSQIAAVASGRAPRRISVTGHSLGGGLALQTASAILLGSRLGPDGKGADMPIALQSWPWSTMKLVTFGASVSGDADWAKALTVDKLQSRFFETAAWGLTLTDPDGLAVNAPEIVSRLVDTRRPAAYRILNPKDPITTLRVLGGKHVGQTVYIAPSNPMGLVDPAVHEPLDIRDRIDAALSDPSVPENGWQYHDLTALSPTSDPSRRGGAAEFDKLFETINSYYQANGSAFDRARFRQDYSIFQRILSNG